jgi:predicted SPOUT superfamily RNA methylase MTH1
VDRAPSLGTALKGREPILGTSRTGEHLAKEHLEPGGVTLVFGSPDQGIEEILGQPPMFPQVNTIPDQGTATVRVEEAVLSSLALIHGVTKGLPGKR